MERPGQAQYTGTVNHILAKFVAVCSLLLLNGCFQTQTMGTVAGAEVTITPLYQPGQVLESFTSSSRALVIEIEGQQIWDNYTPLQQLALLGLFRPQAGQLEPNNYYLITARGGSNRDPQLSGNFQQQARYVLGSWHAILPPNYVVDVRNKISLLSEAAYQWVGWRTGGNNPGTAQLQALLDEAARKLVTDVDGDGNISYVDILRWNVYQHRDLYLGDVAALQQLDAAITLGLPPAEIQHQVLVMLGEYSPPPEPELLDFVKSKLGLSKN